MFSRAISQWSLCRGVRPTSSLYKDSKKTRSRYKRLKEELKECVRGIKFHLLEMCVDEKIFVVNPIAGGKDKSTLYDSTKTAVFLKERFFKNFQLTFDPEKFKKKNPILRRIVPPTGSERLQPVVPEATYLENSTPSSPTSGLPSFLKKSLHIKKTQNQDDTKDVLEVAIPVSVVDASFAEEGNILDKRLYRLIRVRVDNHVIFRSMSHSLSNGRCSSQHEARDVFRLRELACTELLKSIDEPLMTDGTTVKQKILTVSSLNPSKVGVGNAVGDYIRKMMLRKKADFLEIWALSRALKRRISVYEKVFKEDKKTLMHYKHSVSYGVSFGDEVLLYRNGKGDYGCLVTVPKVQIYDKHKSILGRQERTSAMYEPVKEPEAPEEEVVQNVIKFQDMAVSPFRATVEFGQGENDEVDSTGRMDIGGYLEDLEDGASSEGGRQGEIGNEVVSKRRIVQVQNDDVLNDALLYEEALRRDSSASSVNV